MSITKLPTSEEIHEAAIRRKVAERKLISMGTPEWAMEVTSQSEELNEAISYLGVNRDCDESTALASALALVSIARSLEVIAASAELPASYWHEPWSAERIAKFEQEHGKS
jgi:hypothetical protein